VDVIRKFPPADTRADVMAILWRYPILRACVTHNLKVFFFGGM